MRYERSINICSLLEGALRIASGGRFIELEAACRLHVQVREVNQRSWPGDAHPLPVPQSEDDRP